MPAKKLTDLMIEKSPFPATGRTEVWDTLLPGFGLRVGARTKSFVLLYRFKSEKRRLTLGQYPSCKLSDAREAARAILRNVVDGIDPEATQNQAPAAETSPIVRDALARFITRKVQPNRRDWREIQRMLRRDFERRFGDLAVASVTQRDINDLVGDVVDRGAGVQANRLLANLKLFFAWCAEQQYVQASPAAAISKPRRERPRERVLSTAELARIWRAADAQGYPFGPIVKLLILTAQRRDEVAEMRWSEVDLDGALWSLPAARTKSAAAHQIHLSAAAVAVLKALPGGGALLFTKTNETPTSGWSGAKHRLDRRLMAPGPEIGPPAPIAHWTLHDLRRSAATGMAELGVAPHVVDKILNHVQGTIRGVAAIYNRHPYGAERRDALDLWAKHVIAHACHTKIACD